MICVRQAEGARKRSAGLSGMENGRGAKYLHIS